MGANDCTRCGGKPYQCTCTEADFTNDELAERIAELETAYDILEGVKKELEQQNARLTQMISEEPRTKTALPDEFQRLWQACLTLAEKAEFKACFRYLEKLEKQLAERDGLIREYMTESLPYSRRAIEIQQQLEREGGK